MRVHLQALPADSEQDWAPDAELIIESGFEDERCSSLPHDLL